MGTLRFFEEVVSFKIRRTFGFADYKTRRNRFDKAVTPGKGERLLPESKLCFSDQITYHLTPKTLCYAKT